MLAAFPLRRNVENRTHGRLVAAHYLITEDYVLRSIKLLTLLTPLCFSGHQSWVLPPSLEAAMMCS